MGKAAKSTRKFAASGQLKKQIQDRRKHQQIKKRAQTKRTVKHGKTQQHRSDDDGKGEDVDVEEEGGIVRGGNKGKSKGGKKVSTVDDLLGAGFMDEDEDDSEGAVDENFGSEDDDSEGDDEDDDEMVDEDGNASYASLDELDEGKAHLMELSVLAKTDPDFYKYLQENDKDLLDFDPNAAEDEDEDEEMQDGAENDEEEATQSPVLTTEILRRWQKALLEQRSLRALRKLLIAFRAAIYMNSDKSAEVAAWSIDSPAVYNKLLTTSLKYTPIVLAHHAPYKELPSGKIKAPVSSPKLTSLTRLTLAFFSQITHLFTQLPSTGSSELLILALGESIRLLPYVMGSRKAIRAYLKQCLELWATADDDVRIAAFLCIRKLATISDQSLTDLVLKNTYLTLLRTCKNTTPYTLPSLTLMKNSASELFAANPAAVYQHAFGYIRQLAILLRNSLKAKTKESYKQVYNWQYVHCVDFWSIVLGRACSVDAPDSEESELKPLIYPLVQVSLGSIKLISAPRSYPFHLHILRSLLYLTRHTQVFVPLSPYILPIINTALSSSASSKGSSLRPIDLEVTLRVTQQYARTRIVASGLIEEATHVLVAWLAESGAGVIGFPEVVTPIVVSLRRALKAAKSGGGSSNKSRGGGAGIEQGVKTMVERIEETAKWVSQRRAGVVLAPGKVDAVKDWERDVKAALRDESPLGRYLKVLNKTREKRRALVEKARKGEAEIVRDEEEED